MSAEEKDEAAPVIETGAGERIPLLVDYSKFSGSLLGVVAKARVTFDLLEQDIDELATQAIDRVRQRQNHPLLSNKNSGVRFGTGRGRDAFKAKGANVHGKFRGPLLHLVVQVRHNLVDFLGSIDTHKTSPAVGAALFDDSEPTAGEPGGDVVSSPKRAASSPPNL